MAKRSLDNLHPYQQQALDYGADIRWVPNGMLQVTKARAKEYYYENPKKRRLLPLGLEEKRVMEDIRDLAIIDIGNSKYVLVANNNGSVESYEISTEEGFQ